MLHFSINVQDLPLNVSPYWSLTRSSCLLSVCFQRGEEWYSEDCSERCLCLDTGVDCNSYSCPDKSVCDVRDGLRKCYCPSQYVMVDEACRRGMLFLPLLITNNVSSILYMINILISCRSVKYYYDDVEEIIANRGMVSMIMEIRNIYY